MMLRFRAMMSEGWCDPDGRNNDNGAHYFFHWLSPATLPPRTRITKAVRRRFQTGVRGEESMMKRVGSQLR
jgi:hypothetical protein